MMWITAFGSCPAGLPPFSRLCFQCGLRSPPPWSSKMKLARWLERPPLVKLKRAAVIVFEKEAPRFSGPAIFIYYIKYSRKLISAPDDSGQLVSVSVKSSVAVALDGTHTDGWRDTPWPGNIISSCHFPAGASSMT